MRPDAVDNFFVDDFQTFFCRQIFLSTIQAVNRYVFCVVHEKKLLIITSRQYVFSFEKPKQMDCFLLSTTFFSQLLIDNFDNMAAWNDPNLITQKCFLPGG